MSTEEKKNAAEINKEIFSRKLAYWMNRNGENQNDIVNLLGVSASTVSDWMSAKKYPRIDKVQKIADHYGILKSDLTEEKKTNQSNLPDNIIDLDMSKMKCIPILGRIQAGLPIYAIENIEGYTYTELNGNHEYFALRVRGDSMNAARILDGDIVIVQRQDIVEDGDIAVVLIDMEEATLKRFYRSGSTVTLMPNSNNPAHKPQVYNLKETNITILGKVVKVEFML